METPFLVQLILYLVINELVIIGIWNAADKGEILGAPAEWIRKRTPEWVTKPLYDCPPCSASVHGTWFWLLCEGVPKTPVEFVWSFVYVLALSGLGKLVVANLLQQE